MSNELFEVSVAGDAPPVATDGPVVFHGVNKSGSLALADVLRRAYYAEMRANQFFSVYHGLPRHLSDLCAIHDSSHGHNFFVSHNLFDAVDARPGGALVTQVRHPLSRTLSIWGWMKRNHLNRHGNLDGVPALDRWLPALKGYKHTQMYQLAMGFRGGAPERDPTVPLQDLLDIAKENLANVFDWFGVAELFEENIFVMAHICGLRAVGPWEKDTRNRWRDPVSTLDSGMVDLIRGSLEFEFEFYDYALRLFRARLEHIEFGPTLAPYKARCAAAYGERLLDEGSPPG